MRGRQLVGVLCVAVGLVWIGQGTGVLRGSSFMVDDVRWAFAGVALATVGIVVAVWATTRRPGP